MADKTGEPLSPAEAPAVVYVLRDHSCGNCMGDGRKAWRRRFSPIERDALMQTGLTGERINEQPGVAAVLLPRRAFLHMCGMARPGWVNYETPCFRCPWSPAAWPHVICHGSAFRSDAGEAVELNLDGNGCTHRGSHCVANPIAPPDYYVRPFTDPGLPRRVIKKTWRTHDGT